MNELRSLAQVANEGFNGVTSDDARVYCEQYGIPTKSNSTLEYMLSKLRTHVEAGTQAGVVESATKAPPSIVPGRVLNLKAGGKWEGRRRMVEILENEKDVQSSWKCLSWDQSQILVHTGMKVSIPYPHWEILKNNVYEHYVVQTRQVEGGRTESFETTKHLSQMPFRDFEDDPKTAGLPTSWIDRQQTDCRAKNFYKGTRRELLVRLLLEMSDGAITREKLKEQSDEDIREGVVNKLGLYEECMTSQFALDNAA